MFLTFLAFFVIVELILWRTEQVCKSREISPPNSLASILALARSVNGEGRGAAAEIAEKSAVDTLK